MSDVMFFGVLRMPIELAMDSELSRIQFYGRAQEAADRIEQLERDLAEARKDADRYRWLRDISNADEAAKIVGRFIGCDLDTVVDAYISDEGKA